MAYILLHSGLPETRDDSDSVTEKQANELNKSLTA